MSIKYEFNILKDDVSPILAALIARGDNLTPVHDDIGAAMVVSTKLRFEHERGPDGDPWLPSHRALVEGHTLRNKNRLYDSLTHVASPQGVEWGSNVLYAGIHQLGGKAGRGGAVEIPARPYLGVDDDDELTIVSAYADYFRDPTQFGGAP